MKYQLKQMLAASLVAASLAAVSFSANAAILADFTVDEGSVPGTVNAPFEADKINGGYSERISFDGAGGFDTSGFADWGQYFANEGTLLVVDSELNTSYAMYAIFTATGTVTPGPFTTFTPTSASFDLYIDADQDTTKTLPATGAGTVSRGNTGDDYLIASASNLTSGFGILVPGIGGFFDLVFDDFTLTAAGSTYFIEPDPFYIRVNVDGDFDSFTPVGNQVVNGDISAVFAVPEPSTIALLGIGLVGLGYRLRRRAA